MAAGGNPFDASRAELFEALGHPTRVKILKVLESHPLGFADIKREVGIESSGHLQFHLGRLSGLVGTTPEGNYALTDEGKEAIHVLSLTSSNHKAASGAKATPLGRIPTARMLVAILLVLVVVLAGFEVYQQQQIASLSRSISTGTVTIGNTTYYYEELTPYAGDGTSFAFHGVTFAFSATLTAVKYSNLANYTAEGYIRLSNGTVLDVNGKTVRVEGQGYMANQCWTNEPNGTPSGEGLSVSFSIPPTITITFADRAQESYNAPEVTARAVPGMAPYIWVSYAWPSSSPPNPWFGRHLNPQAGIFFDCASPQGSLTVYVSK